MSERHCGDVAMVYDGLPCGPVTDGKVEGLLRLAVGRHRGMYRLLWMVIEANAVFGCQRFALSF